MTVSDRRKGLPFTTHSALSKERHAHKKAEAEKIKAGKGGRKKDPPKKDTKKTEPEKSKTVDDVLPGPKED